MGSMSLVCPMCCGETFDNSQSLKYHLLSMTDNLYCPNCAERFDSVAALIHHLDCCGEGADPISVHPEDGVDHTHCGFLATVNKDGGIVMVEDLCTTGGTKEYNKVDTNEDTGNHDDILDDLNIKVDAKDDMNLDQRYKNIKTSKNTSRILGEKADVFKSESNLDNLNAIEVEAFQDQADKELDEARLCQVKEEIREVETNALYSCSSCGMSFNSVLSHIKEYHNGQEVVLEMAEQQVDDLPEEAQEQDDEEGKEVQTLTTTHSGLSKESSGFCSSGVSERSFGELPRQRQTMNTLRTEECVDSEGRFYTRKVVQIERFWDRGLGATTGAQSQLQQHQQSSKNAPMIEKFFCNAEGLKIGPKSPVTMTTAMTESTMTTATATIANPAAIAAFSLNSRPPLRMYRCNKCLEQFAKLTDFRVHTCIHGNNQCDLCEQAFASAKALQLHSRIHEAEAEGGNDCNFICQTCGTEFSSHKSLRLHSRMHAPVRARHVDAPEGTATENFTCIECGKTLSESYRKAHMALHKGDSVTCSVCNRKFDSADSLAMHAAVHIEFVQSQQKQVQGLSLEEQRIEDESNGSGRKRMKGGNEIQKDTGAGDAPEKPYQCQHCGRRFTRPHEKVKHERIHTGEKPHGCEVCGKTFRVSYCLTLHMRTHTGVRPYACQHCGKRFKASSVYNHHLLTHGEERAYTCPYCPKTFKTRVQLAGHKNSHTKPFRCTECSRPFASLYAARAHIQTHKKDNNLKFSCYICGASYGRAFALKDHLKQHAGQDDLVPPPEPAREEEVIDADDFIITEETEEYEEIEEIEEIEEEEHKLVEVAAAAHVDVHHSI